MMEYKIFVDKGIGPQLIAECIDFGAAVDFAAVYAHNHNMGWMWSKVATKEIVIRPGFTNGKPRLRGGRV
jgi:hypothetical protein